MDNRRFGRHWRTAGGRFWARVRVEDVADPNACWLWMGTLDRHGYGKFHYLDGSCTAHRWAYTEIRGFVPAGLVIDHLCRVRHCVNPDHMEPVTNAENIRRGQWGEDRARSRGRAVWTHCGRGHEFTPENTYKDRNGWRQCRTCARDRERERYHLRKLG